MGRFIYDKNKVDSALDYLKEAKEILKDIPLDMRDGLNLIKFARGSNYFNFDYYSMTSLSAKAIIVIKDLEKQINEKVNMINDYQRDRDEHPIRSALATWSMTSATILRGVAGAFTSLGDGVLSIYGSICGLLGEDWIKDFCEDEIKDKKTDDWFKQQFESGIWSDVEKYSYYSSESTCANVVKAVGSAIPFIAAAVATGGASAAGTISSTTALAADSTLAAYSALGDTVSSSLIAGDDYDTAMLKGAGSAAVAGVSTFGLGKAAEKIGSAIKGAANATESSADDVIKGIAKTADANADDTVRGIGKAVESSADDTVKGIGKAAESSADDTVKGIGKAAESSADDAAKGAEKAAESSADDAAKGAEKAAESSADDAAKGAEKAAESSADDAAKGAEKTAESSTDDAANGAKKTAESSADDVEAESLSYEEASVQAQAAKENLRLKKQLYDDGKISESEYKAAKEQADIANRKFRQAAKAGNHPDEKTYKAQQANGAENAAKDAERAAKRASAAGVDDTVQGAAKTTTSSVDDGAKGAAKTTTSSVDDGAKGAAKAATSSMDDGAKSAAKAATSSMDDGAKSAAKAATSSMDDGVNGATKATSTSYDAGNVFTGDVEGVGTSSFNNFSRDYDFVVNSGSRASKIKSTMSDVASSIKNSASTVGNKVKGTAINMTENLSRAGSMLGNGVVSAAKNPKVASGVFGAGVVAAHYNSSSEDNNLSSADVGGYSFNPNIASITDVGASKVFAEDNVDDDKDKDNSDSANDDTSDQSLVTSNSDIDSSNHGGPSGGSGGKPSIQPNEKSKSISETLNNGDSSKSDLINNNKKEKVKSDIVNNNSVNDSVVNNNTITNNNIPATNNNSPDNSKSNTDNNVYYKPVNDQNNTSDNRVIDLPINNNSNNNSNSNSNDNINFYRGNTTVTGGGSSTSRISNSYGGSKSNTDIVENLNTVVDDVKTSLNNDLGSKVKDIIGQKNIKPIIIDNDSSNSYKKSGVVPIIGGITAASAIGLGTKAVIDRKKNTDNYEKFDENDDVDDNYSDSEGFDENNTSSNNDIEKLYDDNYDEEGLSYNDSYDDVTYDDLEDLVTF